MCACWSRGAIVPLWVVIRSQYVGYLADHDDLTGWGKIGGVHLSYRLKESVGTLSIETDERRLLGFRHYRHYGRQHRDHW